MTYSLDELEALANAATPGPWRIWDGPEYVGGGRDLCVGAGEQWLANMDHRHSDHHDKIVCDYNHNENCDICSLQSDPITKEQETNARFIAVARTAVPELIARVRELEEQLELLKQAHKALLEPQLTSVKLEPWICPQCKDPECG